MATISERLQYILSFDTRQAVSAMDQFGKKADANLELADRKIDKVAGNMMKFGAAAVAAAGVAGMGLWKLAGAASEVEESTNAVNVTFKDSANLIHELGKTSAQSMGLSTAAFNQAAVGFSAFAERVVGEGGNVAQTTADMLQRAADFASVLNLDVRRATEVFRSALAGETESIKQFGIDMSAASVEAYAMANGISTAGSKMTETEKSIARYGLLMQSTEHMAGDFANTSDSLANSQRRLGAQVEDLKANVGAGLVPVFGTMIGAASDVVGVFSDLDPQLQKTIGSVAGFGTAGIAAAGALSFIAGAAIKAKQNFQAVADGFMAMSRGARIATASMGAVALALTAAAALYIGYKKQQEKAEETARALGDAITEQIAALAAEKDLLDELTTDTAKHTAANKLWADAVRESGEVSDDELRKLRDVGESIDSVVALRLKGTAAVEADIAAKLRAAGVSERESKAYAEMIMQRTGYEEVLLLEGGAREKLIRGLAVEADTARLVGEATVEATRDKLMALQAEDAYQGALINRAVAEVNAADATRQITLETANYADMQAISIELAALQASGIDYSRSSLAEWQVAQEQATAATGDSTEATEAGNEAWQDWADTMMDSAQAAEDAYDDMVSAAQDWASEQRAAMSIGSDSFMDFEADAKSSVKNFEDALANNLMNTTLWENDLATIYQSLRTGTTDEKLAYIANLREMGEAGAPLVSKLAEDADGANSTFDLFTEGAKRAKDGMLGEFDPVGTELDRRMGDAKRALVEQMIQIENTARNNAKTIGVAIPDGVIKGIEEQQGALNWRMRLMISQAVAAAKAAAESSSPSKLFAREVGVPIVEGIEEGIVEEGDKIGDSLERAIESAEKDAIDAAEDLVDSARGVLSGLWGDIGDQRSEADQRERVAEAERDLAEAMDEGDPEKIAQAREKLEDANYALAKSTEYMIDGDAATRASWEATALAAGLTATQVQALVQAHDDLTAAMQRSYNEKAAIAGEAARANLIRNDFAYAVGQGWISKEQLAQIATSSDPQAQLDWMALFLNNIQRYFGSEIKQYASGGIVPGTGPQLAVVHGGEEVIPAGGRGGDVYLTVNAGLGVDGVRLGNQLVEIINASYRAGGKRITA